MPPCRVLCHVLVHSGTVAHSTTEEVGFGGAGATEFTAIPLGRRSSALFIAAYARLPAATCRIRLVEMLMMAP